jgi:hypothetical protein
VKLFNYRGGTREFSNRYHFNGGTPADTTHWTTLADAIVTAEKAIAPSLASGGFRITGAYGYAAGSEVPVFSKTYATEGTLAGTGFTLVPGDAAALIRYSTAARTSKNHPLYLFNYYHGVSNTVAGAGQDTLLASQRTAMGTYASAWIAGFSDGTNTLKRAGPNGDLALGQLVNSLLTHRDLPH